MPEQIFDTGFSYSSRRDKPRYVVDKYRDILTDSVLDVGADKGQLGGYLPETVDYLPVGLGPEVEVKINLENGELPFKDDQFECVVCLEVLEHLDNLHRVFDELCRVANSTVIVSLPNPWASFIGMLIRGYYDGERVPMKYYHLPTNPPADRHKWFFGAHEAERFIRERTVLNGGEVLQIDQEWSLNSVLMRKTASLLMRLFLNREVNVESLLRANTWGAIKIAP